jgi:hypothetical protein
MTVDERVQLGLRHPNPVQVKNPISYVIAMHEERPQIVFMPLVVLTLCDDSSIDFPQSVKIALSSVYLLHRERAAYVQC